ncbi:uncharacterized protein [Dermacentor albipictus]|uniref:uncharacterized protein n=1 Tax=Dermacentor albipictus TaxID=60249 RepID=UPI0031FCBCEF
MERRRRWPASYALTGLVLASVGLPAVWARVYDRCELALELHDRFKFPKRDLDKWLCLAYWESRFDTRAYHKGKYDGSGDHGIFQINDKHWCQPHQGHSENVCRMPCYLLRDDNLYDDIECVNKIFRRHGFHAWMMFSHKCSGNTLEFFNGCDFRIRRGDMTSSPTGLQITIEPPPILEKLSQLSKGIYQAGSHPVPTRGAPDPSPGPSAGPPAPRWTSKTNVPQKPRPVVIRPPRPQPPPKKETNAVLPQRPPPLKRLPAPPPPKPPRLVPAAVARPPRQQGPRFPALSRPSLTRAPQPPKTPGGLLMPQESVGHAVFGVPPPFVPTLPGTHQRRPPPPPPPPPPHLLAVPPQGLAMFGLRRGPPPLPIPIHVPPPQEQQSPVVYKRTKTRRLPGGLRLRPFFGFARSSRAFKNKGKT